MRKLMSKRHQYKGWYFFKDMNVFNVTIRNLTTLLFYYLMHIANKLMDDIVLLTLKTIYLSITQAQLAKMC